MKVHAYPSQSVLLGILDEQLMDENKRLSESEAELSGMEETEGSLFTPWGEAEKATARSLIRVIKSTIKSLESQRIMIRSSNQASCHVEFDLDA